MCAKDQNHESFACGCCRSMGRRDFMITVGASALAAHSAVMGMASAVAAPAPEKKGRPRVRAVFLHPNVERYWMGWPGAAYDIRARQADYTKRLRDAAKALDVELEVTDEPINDRAQVDALLAECKQNPPDGVILTVMSLNHAWPHADYFAEQKGDVPAIVFSPMGTSFTGHLQKTRNQPKTFVAATQDLDWLATGMRMLRTIWDMKTSRLLIVNGEKTEDKVLDVIGTTLHYIPLDRWTEELSRAGTTDEMKAIADYYTKLARKIVEPKAEDILNSARNYVVARKLMADENCDGISINCLGLVGARRIPCPPCMAWLRLNDEGSVGCCECDWNAAISLRLNALLCRCPGFMQDPCPNTVAGTLMGAHCSSPTRLRGFDKDPEALILRSHSESAIGVSPQVLWPLGEPATVMKFEGPGRIILGTGEVVANIDTPPAGGCRTSVELAMDNVADPRDCKGFHQLFILGKHERLYRAYCALAGIEVVPI